MSLSLKAHALGRIVAAFAGFFGGGIAFAMLSHRLEVGALAFALLPAMAFGGMYLAQLAFNQIASVKCPRCAEDAAPAGGKDPTAYVCKGCGAELSALGALTGIGGVTRQETMAAAVAKAAPSPAQENQTRTRMGYLFSVIGLIALGIAIWLGEDSIRLVREGVSTDATVVRVTHQSGYGPKQNETHHVAFVEYKVNGQPLVLERSWSSEPGAWTWPSYRQGERLRVIYLPSEPGHAKIHTLPELFFAAGFLALFGLAFTAFGVLMLRYRPKPGETQIEPRAQASPSSSFLKPAISLGVFLAGAGVFYYFVIVKPDIERQRIEAEAAARQAEAAARQAAAAAQAKAAAAARAAAQARAQAMAKALAPIEPRPGMSECQLLLLNQRNQYVEKYGKSGGTRFFNVRPPAGNDCKECLAGLTSKLGSWAGFDVAPMPMASDYPAGCVAYRPDILGTLEGANCLVEFLGSGFSVDRACVADGFPYTITHSAVRSTSSTATGR